MVRLRHHLVANCWEKVWMLKIIQVSSVTMRLGEESLRSCDDKQISSKRGWYQKALLKSSR